MSSTDKVKSTPRKKTGLFIFHRDFRLEDNIGVNYACSQCDKLYTAFIFTPQQVGPQNAFRSFHAISFMIQSLEDLDEKIHDKGGELLYFYGNQTDVLQNLLKILDIDIIVENRDYTPYAIQRENDTMKLCLRISSQTRENVGLPQIEYVAVSGDYYIFEPCTILTGSNTAYKKFTPFYNRVLPLLLKNRISPERQSPRLGRILGKLSSSVYNKIKHRITIENAKRTFVTTATTTVETPPEGGRTVALHVLRRSSVAQKEYNNKHDILTYDTSHLSAYLKFGCISVREMYRTLTDKYGNNSAIIRQFLWREFYAHVLYAYPYVLSDDYKGNYLKLKWREENATAERYFDAWKRGKTGFPVVDAGMRQLNATGFMHNRARLIVAYFLCKTMYINWRKGENYFAKKLVDYDVASNNGNWRTVASVGVDFSPYYNTINPFIQQHKFDPDCKYVKRWVPELWDIEPRDILNWDKEENRQKYKTEYPDPICDLQIQKDKLKHYYGV